MEFPYLAEFAQIIEQINPNKEDLTIEDHLATFAALPPLLNKSEKSAIRAELLRTDGNAVFLSGNYEEAVTMYTRSIKNAPPYSKCIALAYANRSAALYRLKAYEECILDIDRALDLPYPDDLKIKIIERKEAAVTSLNNALKAEQISKNDSVDDLKFAHGNNAKLPSVSRGIDIVYDPKDGRKLVAKMPFKPSDVLVIENPFLPIMRLDQDPAYCHHCFGKSLCLIPCDKCICEMYCSKKCQMEAYESYHRIECEIQLTLMTAIPLDRQLLMCLLRCLTILSGQGNNLNELYDDLKEIEQNSNPEKLGFTGDQFSGNTRKALLSSLHGKEIKHNFELLFQACYLAILLRSFTNFFQTNVDVPIVAKLLVKLEYAHWSTHILMRYFGSQDIKGIGSYPLIGLVRHECSNNTLTYQDKKGRLIVRASQNIKPGDQIIFTQDRLKYAFNEIIAETGRYLKFTRICLECKNAFSYPIEKITRINMDKKLRVKLIRNPYDIMALWKLLNLVHERHQPSASQVEVIKMMLRAAYQKYHGSMDSEPLLRILGMR